MATTVTTLIQRVRRFVQDWPENDTLNASVNSSGTSLTVVDSTWYGRDWVIQIDHEAMKVVSQNGGTIVTVRRGAQGTSPVTHALNASILIRPAWTDLQILDALNAGLDATWPYYYQQVMDSSITSTGSLYEYNVPTMGSAPNAFPMPFVSKIEILMTSDLAWRPLERWEIRRGGTPVIKFRSMIPPGTLRVHGYGPFNQLAFTDSLPALWPIWGDDVLVEYAAQSLLMSGEAYRVRQDTGAKDDRQNSTPPGASSAAANQLLQRFQLRLAQQPMPPIPKHVVRVI